MQSYTVHAPATGATPDEVIDGARFVPDGWSWPALAFGPFWLAWRRQWLALLAYVALYALAVTLGLKFGLHPVAVTLLTGLLNLALALEGGQIRRWTLGRKGWPMVAVVAANSLEEAEAKFLAGLSPVAPSAPPRAATVYAAPRGDADRAVLGVFPEPGASLGGRR